MYIPIDTHTHTHGWMDLNIMVVLTPVQYYKVHSRFLPFHICNFLL